MSTNIYLYLQLAVAIAQSRRSFSGFYWGFVLFLTCIYLKPHFWVWFPKEKVWAFRVSLWENPVPTSVHLIFGSQTATEILGYQEKKRSIKKCQGFFLAWFIYFFSLFSYWPTVILVMADSGRGWCELLSSQLRGKRRINTFFLQNDSFGGSTFIIWLVVTNSS